MTSEKELQGLEITRRKALWTLAGIHPGDPKAHDVLNVLDDIEQRELVGYASEQPLSIEEVQRQVLVEPHKAGRSIVRESSIPQPWHERFLRASLGSTRLEEEPFAVDWYKFLAEWQSEMLFLERHRAARQT